MEGFSAMNIITFIYKFQPYHLDLDLFKKNKGYFFLDGALAHANSFDDLINEKIEIGVSLSAASLAKRSIKTYNGVHIEFVDGRPVSCYLIKNTLNSDQLAQYKGQAQKICNEMFEKDKASIFRVCSFARVEDGNFYFAKIFDTNQFLPNSKEHEEYLNSR
jgi:hypothetical protein